MDTEQRMYNVWALIMGIYAIGGLILLAILVLYYVGQWKTFKKLGLQPWACLIPVYSTWVLANRVVKRNMAIAATVVAGFSWVLAFVYSGREQSGSVRAVISFVALVSFAMTAILMYALAQKFGFGPAFAVGLLFLPFIFFMYLGFSKAQVVGARVPAGLPAAGESTGGSSYGADGSDAYAPEDNSPIQED